MADKFPKEFIVYSATRASFEAQVASGEVDNTQIGIIAESGEFWENGNYHPLVMLSDYLKKTDAVALAKDLTGSIEATPEEFTFRPSAGTKSIRDESAVIRRIKGNTSVWGQQFDLKNGTFSFGGATGVKDLDGYTITTNESSTSKDIFRSNKAIPFNAHKWLAIATIHSPIKVNIRGMSTLGFVANTKCNIHSFYSSDMRNWYWGLTVAELGVTATIKVYDYQLFDLTQIFGAGNEPTTLEQFKKIYPESHYPYCVPEVRSMRATGIETIGANAFDKDSVMRGKLNADGSVTTNDKYSVAKIEVVPYEKYTLTNVANAYNSDFTYALYDSNDTFLSIGQLTYNSATVVTRTGDVTMPLNARYMRVVVHNDYISSCCVNLKHSGTLTAEEATYFKEVRMLPDIAKYFPDGMHGIGEVYDEINEENAIKRFGVVDLGTLSWIPSGTDTSGVYRWHASPAISRPTIGTHDIPNIICLKYITGSNGDTYYVDGDCISVSAAGNIRIFDSNFTAEADKDAFVASLQGILLYYELNEPIVTPITEPLQWDYKVADFGTEKMLSNLPSSPFRADIVYQFNAADRIRDNARNIERLEEYTKNMATMEDIINAIPTEIATATQLEEYTVTDGSQLLYPNIMYEYRGGGIGATGSFVMPNIVTMANRSYDHQWMLRIPQITNGATIIFPYDIMWQDGFEPNIPTSGCLEIYLKDVQYAGIIGEWKFYPNI